MTDASTIALQQIIARLEAIVNRLNSKTSYQEHAEEALNAFREKRDKTTKDTKDSKLSVTYLKKLLDIQSASTLTSSETTRYKNIAKIFSNILNVDTISKSIDRMRKFAEETAEQQRRESLLNKRVPATVAAAKSFREEKQKQKTDTNLSLYSLAKLAAISAALTALNKFLKGTGNIGPLTGIVDILSKWTTVGILKKVSNFFKLITTPLSIFTKMLTGKTIGENISAILKSTLDTISKTASSVGAYIGKKFTGVSKYLIEFFPRITSNISSITSIFTQSFAAISNRIGSIGISKDFFGKLFKTVLGPIAKITSKTGLKLLTTIPGIGALISFYFAYDRYKSGDTTGAIIEVAAGLANLIPIPFVGSALSLGISMINAFRDLTGSSKSSSADPNPSWFSKLLDSVGETINKNCYNWPVLGPMIRMVQHFKNGDYISALNSIAHIVTPIGWVLDLIGIKESPTEGRTVLGAADIVKGMVGFLGDVLMSIPGVGNVLRSLEHFVSGNFEAGFAEILPSSVMDIYRKFRGKGESKTNNIKAPTSSNSPNINENNNTQIKIPTATSTQVQPQLTQPITRVEMTGIKDLHAAMMQMNQAELSILTEQRNLLNDNKSLLKIIAERIGTMSVDNQSQTIQPSSSVKLREELSNTRKRYLENKNIFGASLT